jgi:hypothetical protein
MSPEGASSGSLRSRHLALQESMTQIDALRAELDSVRARAEVLNMPGTQAQVSPPTEQTGG